MRKRVRRRDRERGERRERGIAENESRKNTKKWKISINKKKKNP